MFSNKPLWPRSAKTRIALLYATLFLLSFVILFVLVCAFWGVGNRDLLDRELEERLNRAGYVYWTGQLPPDDLRVLGLSGGTVRKMLVTVRRELPGFRVLFAYKEGESGRTVTAVGMAAGKLFRVTGEEGAARPRVEPFVRPEEADRAVLELCERGVTSGRRRNYFVLLDRSRRFPADPMLPAGEKEAFEAFDYSGRPGKIHFGVLQARRNRIRIAWRVFDDGRLLAAGINLHDVDTMQYRAAIVFLAVGASVLLLSAAAGWLLAHWMFGEVGKVSLAAEAIAAGGDYSRRVPEGRSGGEIRRLSRSFNTMVANTEAAMKELRTISDNIAHDLRTPLTRMLGRAELTVTGEQTLEAYRETLGDNAEECRRMLSLINLMLEIARTESGAARLRREALDLREPVAQALALFRMVTESKSQTLTGVLPDAPVTVMGDKLKLQQVIANLLDNAAKFTPEHGSITVTLAAAGPEAVLTVRDSGPGIAPEDQDKVFKRFYRADSSRNLPGNGLGLSLVSAVVHAHGGTVTLRSGPGSGSEFTVTLPLA